MIGSTISKVVSDLAEAGLHPVESRGAPELDASHALRYPVRQVKRVSVR